MVEFSDKCGILGELWVNYKDDKSLGDFMDFIEYNDIGLPLAYGVAEGLIREVTPLGEDYIKESFAMLIGGLELEEHEFQDGWTLTEMLSYITERNKKK